jgi:NADH-quinone oxidoreductase subunit M
MVFPILSLIFLAPVVGGAMVLMLPKERQDLIKTVAAASVGVSLVLSLLVVLTYNSAQGGFQFQEKLSWIPALGITYHVAVDGFSAPLLLLNAIVGFCAILVSWNLNDRSREFFAYLLFLIAGVFGAFMTLDLFVFLIFYELVFFPVYVLVAGWGSKNREYAAMKLTIYLFLGSLASLVGIMAMYFAAGKFMAGGPSFNFFDLQAGIAALGNSTQLQRFWFLPVFIGFGVLASIWPLHNWSPDGYAAAPTPVSMLHGGVLKATGAYAAVRFAVQLMPEGAKYWLPLVVFLCLANVIYAGLVAFRQRDLKYIIGFSSVAHLGLVLMGICALNVYGLNGAGLELFAGGVMTGLMFALVGIVYERSHERDYTRLDGLAKVMPFAAVGYVIGSLAAMGMPGLSGFPAELQIFMGLWQAAQTKSLIFANSTNWWYSWIAIIGVLTVVITAAWTLRVGAKMYFSEPQTPAWQELPRLTGAEKFSIVLMSAVLIYVGVYPAPVMQIIETGVTAMVKAILG